MNVTLLICRIYDTTGRSEYTQSAYLSEEKANAERDRLNANLKARNDYGEDYETSTVNVADAEDKP